MDSTLEEYSETLLLVTVPFLEDEVDRDYFLSEPLVDTLSFLCDGGLCIYFIDYCGLTSSSSKFSYCSSTTVGSYLMGSTITAFLC